MRVYMAGPLFSEAETQFNVKLAAALRAAGHEVFAPQEIDQNLSTGYPARIFKADVEAQDWAEIYVAVLDGPDVDSGTAWEMGYARGKGKLIFGLRTDFRIFGPEEKINLMCQESCVNISDTIEGVVAAVSG